MKNRFSPIPTVFYLMCRFGIGLFFVFLSSVNISAQTQLTFSGTPTVSGTAGAVNTTYTYNNVGTTGSTTIRGVIKILSITGGASLYTIDAASGGAANAWQPVINGPTTSNGSCWGITFEISFFDASNGFPLTLSSFRANGIDIDGDGGTLREYNEPYGLSSYTVESPSDLVVSPVSGGGYHFRSPQTGYSGISLTQTNVAATWYYNNIQKMNIRLGSCCVGGSCNATGSTSRQSSINFYDAVAYNVGSTILPVSFLSFSGKRLMDTNYINWTVAQQANVVQYIVERSFEAAGPFNKIAAIPSINNNSETIIYSHKDEESATTAFYKVTAVDKDGIKSSTTIIKVNSAPVNGTFKVFNDSRSGKIQVHFIAEKDKQMKMRITDFNGRILVTDNLNVRTGTNVFSIDNTHLRRAGIYLIQVSDNTGLNYSSRIAVY